MSGYVNRWRTAVWEAGKSELTPTERLVLQAMSRYADFETGANCRPGARRIAADTALSEKCVIRTRVALVDKGWLALVSGNRGGVGKGGKRFASIYQLTAPPPVGNSARTGDRESPVDGPTGDPESTTGDPESPDRYPRVPPPSSTFSEPSASTGDRPSPVCPSQCDGGWHQVGKAVDRCADPRCPHSPGKRHRRAA